MGLCYTGFGLALLTELLLGGNRQAVLQVRRVRLVGLRNQLGDFQIKGLKGSLGVAAANRSVFARVGQNPCTVDGHADLAELQNPAAREHFEELPEGLGQQRTGFSAKPAKRVMIGFRVRAVQAHHDAFATDTLDLGLENISVAFL